VTAQTPVEALAQIGRVAAAIAAADMHAGARAAQSAVGACSGRRGGRDGEVLGTLEDQAAAVGMRAAALTLALLEQEVVASGSPRVALGGLRLQRDVHAVVASGKVVEDLAEGASTARTADGNVELADAQPIGELPENVEDERSALLASLWLRLERQHRASVIVAVWAGLKHFADPERLAILDQLDKIRNTDTDAQAVANVTVNGVVGEGLGAQIGATLEVTIADDGRQRRQRRTHKVDTYFALLSGIVTQAKVGVRNSRTHNSGRAKTNWTGAIDFMGAIALLSSERSADQEAHK